MNATLAFPRGLRLASRSLRRARAIITCAVLLSAGTALASSASAQSLDRARQLFDQAKYAEAKSELLALQKVNDRSAEAAYYLGRIAMVGNQGEEAIRHFERAVQLEERNALYHYWLGSAIREVTPHAGMVRIPFYARRLKKAFDRAVELDPNQIDARFGLVQYYASAPAALGGSRDRAREQAAEIARRNAMRGAMARGFIAEMAENAEAEEAAYRQAIAAAPDSLPGYEALAGLYARNGNAPQAFATMERYAQRRPDDRLTLYHIGRIAALTSQQLDRGEAALKQFLASPPPDASVATIAGAHFRLGQIAEKRGATAAARENYQRAVRLNPNSQAKKALEKLR